MLIASQLFIASCSDDEENAAEAVITAADVTFTIAENPTERQVIGTIDASINTGDQLFFTVTSESVIGALTIDNQSGQLLVNDPAFFDFETNPTITGTVAISDGDQSVDITVTITVTDVLEDGLSASNFTLELEAQPEEGSTLGTIQAETTNGEDITFEITAEEPAGALSVGQTTGVITVADATLFDITATNEITATVTVSAGDLSQEVTISISLMEPSPFTIWDGPDFTFTKADGANPNTARDVLTDNVIITRGNNGGQIYNAVSESEASQSSSPAGTEWAEGSIDDIANLTFRPFRSAVGRPRDVVGKNLVLHLIEDDIYVSVRFTSWARQRGGGFSYIRSSE